jgi:pyruvate,water dikinase
MGWRDCQIDVGTFSDHEMDARQPEVVGLFGGYLFINASTARLFGVRGPGLAPEMIDATYFGTHPDVPPYIPEPWHENEENTAKLAAWMGRVMTAQSLPELLEDQKISNEARASRPDLANLDEVSLINRLSVFTVTRKRNFAKAPIGCSLIDAAAPVCKLEVGHISRGTRRSRTYEAKRPNLACPLEKSMSSIILTP